MELPAEFLELFRLVHPTDDDDVRRLRPAVPRRETDDDLLTVTEPLEEPKLLCDLPLVRRHDVAPATDDLERTPLTDDDLVLVPATVVRMEVENPRDVALRPTVTGDLEPRELVDLVDLAGLVAEKPLFEEPFRDLLESVVVLLDVVEGRAESLELFRGDRVEKDLFDPSDPREPRVEVARVAPGAERVRKEADDAGETDRRDPTACDLDEPPRLGCASAKAATNAITMREAASTLNAPFLVISFHLPDPL